MNIIKINIKDFSPRQSRIEDFTPDNIISKEMIVVISLSNIRFYKHGDIDPAIHDSAIYI